MGLQGPRLDLRPVCGRDKNKDRKDSLFSNSTPGGVSTKRPDSRVLPSPCACCAALRVWGDYGRPEPARGAAPFVLCAGRPRREGTLSTRNLLNCALDPEHYCTVGWFPNPDAPDTCGANPSNQDFEPPNSPPNVFVSTNIIIRDTHYTAATAGGFRWRGPL